MKAPEFLAVSCTRHVSLWSTNTDTSTNMDTNMSVDTHMSADMNTNTNEIPLLPPAFALHC